MSPRPKAAATAVATPPPAAETNILDTPLVQSFKAARRVSTPIVAIETPDPASTISILRRVLPDRTPLLSWDCAQGLKGLNEYGKVAFQKLGVEQAMTVNCAETLLAADKLPDDSVLFMHNLHLQLKDGSGATNGPVVQGLWNLRDVFKLNKRMVVGLGPTFQLPLEVAGDIIVLDEPLPSREILSGVVDQQHKNADIKLPDEEVRNAALDALVGLPYYTAEQVTAMSLEKIPDASEPDGFRRGLNILKLWERKIKAIENTDGLRVWQPRPGETTLEELQGIDNVVEFMRRLINADAFGAIVFIDEMDKALAGGMSEHTGDSGVSKDQVGTLLSYIEDTQSLGVMLAGVAGTGKTQLAKATGAACDKPVIVFDLGGMKGGIVGESERRIRAALKVVSATAEGRVLFIGTANRTTLFTPELNRRFPDQFFYDIPDDAGRKAIWPVYVKKNRLTASQQVVPDGFDEGWTGAEIKRACERAALFGCSVVDAARFIIPSSVSGRSAIAELRRQANGRFLSASYPGFYLNPEDPANRATEHNRQIDV